MRARIWAPLILGFVAIQAFSTPLGAQAAAQSIPRPVAQVRERIETDRFEVRAYQARKPVRLANFMELFVITPVSATPQNIEDLVGRSVAIVRSQKQPDRWEVYRDVFAASLTLAGNVFKVKQVFVSSAQSPIELRLDEKIVPIKPGDVLLVL